MKQYFYIPKTYEVALSTEIETYLSNSSNYFTIVIGVYQTTTETVDTSNSLVYSRLINGTIQNIPNGIEYNNFGQNIKKKLIGFILEGNFQTELPLLYAQIQSLPDCITFDTNTECLNFLKYNG